MIRVLLYALPLILAIYALIDCIQTDSSEVRGLPKLGWIALIVLFWVAGPIAWLVAGRPRGGRRAGWPAGPASGRPGAQPPPRIVAPDDDPEFLRQLQRSNKEHEQLLEQWEQDLRRREQESRGEDGQRGQSGQGGNGDPSQDDRPDDEPPAR